MPAAVTPSPVARPRNPRRDSASEPCSPGCMANLPASLARSLRLRVLLRGCGPQPCAGPPIFLPRWCKDIEDHAALAERPSAVGHVRRRLPKIACPDGKFPPFLNPDPPALETHAPLLVRMRVHRRLRPRLQLDDRKHQVRPGKDPSPDARGERPRNASLT